jgi:hypothetical protein
MKLSLWSCHQENFCKNPNSIPTEVVFLSFGSPGQLSYPWFGSCVPLVPPK